MLSFLVVGFLSATYAQVKNLIVQQGSDVTLEIPLSESPQLTYEGTDVVIKYGDNTFSLPVSSKFNIFFEKTGTSIERLIAEKSLLTDGSTVILSNQPVLHFNDGTTQTFMNFFSDPVYGPLVDIYIGVMEVFYKIYKNSKSVDDGGDDDDDDSQEGDNPEDNVANKLWGSWSISYATGQKATVFFGKRGAYSYTYDGTTKTGSYQVNSYSHMTASEWQTDSGWLGSVTLDYNGKVEEQTFFLFSAEFCSKKVIFL